jgi:hypothetical protein
MARIISATSLHNTKDILLVDAVPTRVYFTIYHHVPTIVEVVLASVVLPEPGLSFIYLRGLARS